MSIVNKFNVDMLKSDLPALRPGLTLRIHQKIKEGIKTRTQIFEGLVIAQKHGRGANGTVIVRKVSNGIGVERTFPLHLPTIEKIEVVKSAKVRRSKLYYLRDKTARETRRKIKSISNIISPESKKVIVSEAPVQDIEQG